MKQVIKQIKKAVTDITVNIKHKLKLVFCRKDVHQGEVVEDIIAEGVKAHSEVFSGLYEPMHMVASGRLGGKLGVFDEWCLRAGNINDGTLFSQIFVSKFSNFKEWKDEEYINNAKLIINSITKAGVVRDSFKEILVDEHTYLSYGALDGRELKAGETILVLMPCWQKDEVILEKGILQ
jgi:hypothetical protein